MAKKRKYPWVHTGGGCGIGDSSSHPCDDTYENRDTGERVTFLSSIEAHFSMPEKLENLKNISRRKGVKLEERLTKAEHERRLNEYEF